MSWPAIIGCIWLTGFVLVGLPMWAICHVGKRSEQHFLRCRTEGCGAGEASPPDATEITGPAFY